MITSNAINPNLKVTCLISIFKKLVILNALIEEFI